MRSRRLQSLALPLVASLLVLACGDPTGAPDARPADPTAAAARGGRDANGPTSLDLIETDAERGLLDRDAAARLRAYALLARDRLPAKYRSAAIGKDATESLRRTALAWRDLSARTRKEIADLQGNGFGQLKDSLVTPHFVLRYTTQGGWAVPSQDADADAVPDYIEEAAQALEQSWDREVVQLGYPAPKQLAPGQRTYVYFQDMDVYGYTAAENVVLEQSSPVPAGTATAWMALENDFAGFPPNDLDVTGQEPLRLGALRVTAAHEFMHALQFNINVYASGWLSESHATWAEDQVFDAVNDWHWYLPSFLRRPDLPLFARYLYGAAFFQHHVSETYGLDVPRRIWYATREVGTAEAVRREAYGSAGWTPYAAFGPVQATLGIEDFASGGSAVVPRPAMAVRDTHATYPVSVSVVPAKKVASLAPWGLGANAVVFLPGTGRATLRVSFDGDDGFAWRAFLVGTRGNGTVSVQSLGLDAGGAGSATVTGFGSQFVKVTLVPIIADDEGVEVPYRYSASLE